MSIVLCVGGGEGGSPDRLRTMFQLSLDGPGSSSSAELGTSEDDGLHPATQEQQEMSVM